VFLNGKAIFLEALPPPHLNENQIPCAPQRANQIKLWLLYPDTSWKLLNSENCLSSFSISHAFPSHMQQSGLLRLWFLLCFHYFESSKRVLRTKYCGEWRQGIIPM